MILLLVLTVLPVCIYGDICTDSKKLEEIATNCATKDILSFYQSTTTEAKCGYLLNNVQMCVFDTVNNTYDKICSAKDKHQMIVDFKDEVMQFLQFDINLCIPQRSCSNIVSILYYLPVICESVYYQFVQTGNCSIYLDNINCYKDNINTTESCDNSVMDGIIKSNIDMWKGSTKQQANCPGFTESEDGDTSSADTMTSYFYKLFCFFLCLPFVFVIL
ncbi:uncharacterized protein LOC127721503 [Mytilus californianus]|uniref:uncharacterized protein LOC127721503 n=1 Tax=Mytilus californianus TaxID=6549 RepID=UPI002245F8DB|nr:uncharacterized protein LOC127721503 [Mytilus californianus]